MPDKDLIATRDFSYATRRLRAGDSFTAPARDARVLIAIKRAEEPRKVGRVAPPPAAVVERAAATTPQRQHLDHDNDGKAGGSQRGTASTRSKGARRRKAAAKKD